VIGEQSRAEKGSTMQITGKRRSVEVAGMVRACLAAALLMLVMIAAPDRAQASAAMGAAAATANAGLSGCASSSGKALYNCVADVLDRLSSDIATDNVAETRGALRSAAAGLRAATSKVQALSAIAQCRSVISSALRQIKAAGGAYLRGWGGGAGGGSGLAAVAGVLARAAKLIQSKG
jgi:hypothetical protein